MHLKFLSARTKANEFALLPKIQKAEPKMKKILVLFVLLGLSSVARSEVQIKPPEILLSASSVAVVLEDNLKKSIVIMENGAWKDKNLIKDRKMEIRTIVFTIPNTKLPHLIQVYKGNVIFIHKQGLLNYEITIPVSEFLHRIAPQHL